MRVHTATVRLALVLALLLPAAPLLAAEREVARDDGEQAGKQSIAGTGHGILFDAPKRERWITAVRVHGARYGGGYDPATATFHVAVCDQHLAVLHEIEAPYSLFAAGRFGWVDVPLDVALEVPDRFAVVVAFDPTASRGVFVGWAHTEGSHSFQGLPGGERRPVATDREWMIRAVLASRPPRDLPRVVEVAVEDGEKIGEKSLGGSAHTVLLRRPSGSWWVTTVRVYGRRYGGGYDPAKTTFSVVLRDRRGRVLGEAEAPYGAFGTGGFSWVDVPIPKALEIPSRFLGTVDFEPTRTKGVYVAYAKPTAKGAAFTGRADEEPRDFGDGAWMIRARLVDREPQPPEAMPEPTADPARYLDDLRAVGRIVAKNFPVFEKKGIDWKTVLDEFEARVRDVHDDAAYVLEIHRLLARLDDVHSGVLDAKVDVHVPSFDGLYGAGLWIARDRGRLLLRAATPGHPLLDRVPPGSLLLRVGGRPAGVVLAETRRRLHTWHGWSSDAFLDARLSFQFFPFGEAKTLEATFLPLSGGRAVTVDLARWGPGGRGLSRQAATMPDGVPAEGPVASAKLAGEIGYLRILGGMDERTEKAFFEAVDGLKGVKGILLDARGMGGGSDRPAWRMAGRFFSKRRRLPNDPDLEPTGDWPFDGPVVMLQDERMVSSAETFTWAMVETDRALSVGRPTGGGTIIPRVFDDPAGLFRFRLGCVDRETSVEGVHPEGVGTAPDVFVPYDAWLLALHPDPVRAVGLDVLRRLVQGQPAEVVAAGYGGVLGAAPDRLGDGAWKAFAALAEPAGLDLPGLCPHAARRMIDEEIRVHDAEADPVPDGGGSSERLAALARVADAVGLEDAARRAREALEAWLSEGR